MPATVELRDVRKSFGNADIIKGVSLTIKPGEFVVFVGPSGCGKSTLLRIIAGLEEITQGEMLFDDVVVNEWDPAKRRVGMVFQSYALYPHMSVEQNIGFGLKLAQMDKAELTERVENALRVLQLTNLRKHKPSQLSGGQRQRVAIGRAIVRQPNVFLFDEPLSNLDASLRGQMRMEIGRLHQKLKNTVIYVTHDQVEAMTLADRIVVLEGGYIRQIGTPMELYEQPANRFVAGFIGTPTMGFLDPEAFSRSLKGAHSVGIRPEHCHICPEADATLSGTVVMLERLGADTFAFLDLPGATEPVAVRLSSKDTDVAQGQRVGFGFDPIHAHLFDVEGNTLPKAKI